MEFIVHMPQNLNPEGTLWQTWNAFHQKFKYYQSTELRGTTLAEVSSLLLFAAHHQIEALTTALSIYDVDFPKLNAILQVVEETCLPYFILLFERFRYFNLNRDISSHSNELSDILQKQVDICEFTHLKDSIVTHALCGSLKSGMLLQHLSNPDGLHMDDIKALYNEIEKGQRADEDKLSNPVPVSVVEEKAAVVEEKSADGVEEKVARKRRKKVAKLKEIRDVFSDEAGVTPTVTEAVASEVNDEFILPFLKEANVAEVAANIKIEDASIINESIEKALKKKFHCCFCERAFVGTLCLRKHLMKAHKGRKRFPCKLCATTTFPDADKYLTHWGSVHACIKVKADAPYPDAQQLESTEKGLARKYVRAHSFPCNACDQVYFRRNDLYAHIQEDHSRSYMCWHCGENFNILSDYKIHATEHYTTHKFSCDLCQRQYSSLFGLYIHVHKHLVPRNKCEICGAIFTKSETLVRHLKKHIIQPAHICNVCGKSFVTESRLQGHMWTHTGEKRFTCELCGKMYAHRNNLVHHKRWHAGEKPYECDYCGKHFRCSGDLIKHRRKHYDKSAYVCEICGRGFSYRSALVRHRLGHSGKRNFACNVCGRTFIYSEGLRDHIKASRCPGRKTEPDYMMGRIRRSSKVMQLQPEMEEEMIDLDTKMIDLDTKMIDMDAKMIDMDSKMIDMDSKVYVQVHSEDGTEAALREIQDWHFLLRNEADEGAIVVLVQ